MAYAKGLVDAVNRHRMGRGGDIDSAVSPIEHAELRRDVARVQFHPGMAIVVKKF